MHRELYNVATSFSQRRQYDFQDGQPEVQILTEPVFLHRFFKISVRGSNYAAVYRNGLSAADTLNFDLVF